jgi:hypothetical protein
MTVVIWRRQRNSGGVLNAPKPLLRHGHCKASLGLQGICVLDDQYLHIYWLMVLKLQKIMLREETA